MEEGPGLGCFPIASTRGLVRALVTGALLITPAAQAGLKFSYVTYLTPMQELPANFSSAALGAGSFTIDVTANTLTYSIVIGDLSGTETVATIDGPAEPGAIGVGAAFTLPLGSRKAGVWNYPEGLQADLLSGLYYVQIKSTAFPGGELRGQIVTHVATLDSDQVVPPAASAGSGWGTFVVNPFTHTLKYHINYYNLCSFELGSSISGNAPHQANGAPLLTLPAGSVKTGAWSYPSQAALDDGLLYINVKTICFSAGELRGQITRYVSPIEASQEVPPGGSSAVGMGLYSLQPSSATVGMHLLRSALAGTETSVTFNGFTVRGANGSILYTLPSTGGEPFRLGAYVYGAANESKIRTGQTYANFRSSSATSGEIRGQFEPQPSFCVGDLNGDRLIDLSDLSLLLSNYGTAGVGPEHGDVTGDGLVDLSDLSLLLSQFGAACP